MFANRDGRFLASLLERGVSESGPNKLVTFTARFRLVYEYADGDWQECEDMEITGYFYLEKTDGSLNTYTIEKLKQALGWDGRDPFWLEDAELDEDLLVQLTLGHEEYEGKSRLKIKWIDARDAQPSGVKRSDDSARRAISNRIGAKFRAHAGGTPRPAPPPTTKKPAPTKAKRPSKPPAASAPPRASTMDEAWAIFVETCPESMDDAARETQWFKILGELVPHKSPEQFTADDWQKVADEGPGKLVPF